MKTNLSILLAASLAWMTAPARADEISLASAPPVVVQTTPVAGDTAVDPARTEIRVTYSKAMQDGSWSWSTWGEENYPEMIGQPRYLADGRTCVASVKLQPGKFYAIWLNSDKFKNFKDRDGRPAVPYLLSFTTASQPVSAERATEIITASIKTISQCAEDDPRVTEALAKLRTVPEKKVVSGLVPYLDAPQDTIRRSAVYVLWRGEFGDIGPATVALQKLLSHREDLTRGMAALALGENKVAASYDAMAKMATDDSSGYARRCAAYALGLLGDHRAEPVLRKALEDSDPLVRGNATKALALLDTKRSESPATAGATPSPVIERKVDKAISELSAIEDLSTPEGACVAWQRANAAKDVNTICRLSLVPLDPKEQENWFTQEEKRDAQGLTVYLKAIAESRVLVVQTWRGELASVITQLPFPPGKGRHPFSARTFGLVNGVWKNLGEDRLPDLESAKVNFEKKKETLWQRFMVLKKKPTITAPGPNKSAASVSDKSLAALNDDQCAVLAWTDRQFRSYFDARTFEGWSDAERAALETRLIDTLKGPQSRDYYQAINTLGALHSTNALPALRAIAHERADKNNRDRWMAIRSLGLIGDKTDVPELIHLVYHGNANTHWWAQISLVRLTGQNFGSDWNAWAKWWSESKGQPAYNPEIIRWWNGQAESDKLAASIAESDQKFLADIRSK